MPDVTAALFERRTVSLPDGRRLAYAEFGDPNGTPCVNHHGTPSSAGEAFWLHRAAQQHGVRLIGVDRPGYVGSTPCPGQTFTAWARDLTVLVDELGLERFAVTGFSGGSGPALAAAVELRDRVTITHIGGGMGIFDAAAAAQMHASNRLLFRLIATRPRIAAAVCGPLMRLHAARLGRQARDPRRTAELFLVGSSKGQSQRQATARFVAESSDAELASCVAEILASAGRLEPILADLAAYTRPWEVALDQATGPVHLWHGGADASVPLVFARDLARRLPNATLHEFPDEGHFVFHSHGDHVVQMIAAAA